MDKEKVIEYVMNSPQNTNRAVLSTLLDEGESEAPKKLHLIYDQSTSTYGIDESERYLIDEAKDAFDAKMLNIQVFTGIDYYLGLLQTEHGYMGSKTGFLYVGYCNESYESGSTHDGVRTPARIYCQIIIYRINTTDYTVSVFNKNNAVSFDLE